MTWFLLIGLASADPACVTLHWDSPTPGWASSLPSPTVLGEFAVESGAGGVRARDLAGQRAAAAGRDALLRAMEAAGRPLVRLSSTLIDTPWASCPYFPPVPVVPGRCPLGSCRPLDTRTDRCGSGPGRGVPAVAALAVRAMVATGVNERGHPKVWDVTASVGLAVRGATAPFPDYVAVGHIGEGCTPKEPRTWEAFSERLAALLTAGG